MSMLVRKWAWVASVDQSQISQMPNGFNLFRCTFISWFEFRRKFWQALARSIVAEESMLRLL